jgi:uncharacterized protein YlzI (FlbEa/FlbD family)
MKRAGVFFSFILLTAMNGDPVWVDSMAVDIIRTHTVQCHEAHRAVIRIGATTICVKETPEEIQEKIKKANEGSK